MRISAESIAAVKERARLIDIVSESVSLKRQGSSLVGLCPFHTEKTPSFHVNEDGRFYCFGCEEHGDTISFVMKMRGLSYPQAVEELAQRYGITLKYEGGARRERPLSDLKALYRINEMAARFYGAAYQGGNAGEARRYVQERGINAEAQKAFGVGFAPKEWSCLADHLLRSKVPEPLLLTSGLVKRNSRGNLCDTFRGRIIFPVFIDERRIAGFGGRVLPALFDKEALASAPKYLNSPETPLYQKSKLFFGLPQAQQAARRSGEIYLVEGYMDVIGVWQFGVRNVVATCGTAVTDKHVDRLKHLVKRVIFLFDGDSAGRAGAGKAFPLFLNSGIDACAAFLPEGEDPDTFALKNPERVAEALSALGRVTLLDCFIDSRIAAAGVPDAKSLGAAAKGKICEELSALLSTVQNAIERSELSQKAALRLMIDPSLADRFLTVGKSVSSKPLPVRPSANAAAQEGDSAGDQDATTPSIDRLPALDRSMLNVVMVLREEITDEILKDPDLCGLLDRHTINFVMRLNDVLSLESPSEEEKKKGIKYLLGECGESWVRHWKNAYKMHQTDSRAIWKEYEECRLRVQNIKLDQKIALLDQQIAACSNDKERENLYLLKVEWTRKRKEAGRSP